MRRLFVFSLMALSINSSLNSMELSDSKKYEIVHQSKVDKIEKKPALHVAVLNNDIHKVQELIDQKVDVNEKCNGVTPLHYVCQTGNLPIAQKLLNAGARLDIPYLIPGNGKIFTYPLHIAAMHRHPHLIYLFTANGAHEVFDSNKFTALCVAAEIGDESTVQALLDCKADPLIGVNIGKNKKDCLRPFNLALLKNHKTIARTLINALSPSSATSLLHIAAQNNNKQAIHYYLNNGGDINIKAGNKRTPLHLACWEADACCVEMLLKSQADPNAQDERGMSPLMYVLNSAVLKKMQPYIEKKVELLLSYGALVNMKDNDGRNILFFAISHIELFRQFIDAGADIHFKRSTDNMTLLHMAALLSDHAEAVIVARTLIEKGADVNAINTERGTPLIIAANNNNLELVKLLLNSGADPNLAFDSCIPIMVAITNKNIEMIKLFLELGVDGNLFCGESNDNLLLYTIKQFSSFDANTFNEKDVCKSILKLLLNYGADINHKDKNNETLLLKVVIVGPVELVEFLLQNKAKTDGFDTYGRTALFYAVCKNDYDLVEMLLKYGADVNIKQKKYGSTALHKAASSGFHDISKLLLKYGADKNIQDDNGNYPIDIARAFNFDNVVDLLKDKEKSMNDQDYNCWRCNIL